MRSRVVDGAPGEEGADPQESPDRLPEDDLAFPSEPKRALPRQSGSRTLVGSQNRRHYSQPHL